MGVLSPKLVFDVISSDVASRWWRCIWMSAAPRQRLGCPPSASLLWSLNSCSFFRCVIWFRYGPWRLHLLIRCHPCSSFAQLFEVRRWQYRAQCVCARRSRSFTWWSLGVVKLLHVLLEVYLLIETRQRSSAWALLVENTNRTKIIFILLYP